VHGAGRVRLGAQRHLKAHQEAPEVAKRVPSGLSRQTPASHAKSKREPGTHEAPGWFVNRSQGIP